MFQKKNKFTFPHEEACWNRGLYCDECHAKYVSTSALVGHKQAKHTDLPSHDIYLCNYCGQSFLKGELANTGEKPYTYIECGNSFQSHGANKNHLRDHKEKEHKCSFCGKMFMQRQHLVVHERRHTGDKRHKCDECGKASYLKFEAVGRSRDDEEAQLVNI